MLDAIRKMKLDWKTGARLGLILGILSYILGFQIMPALVNETAGLLIASTLFHTAPLVSALIPIGITLTYVVSFLIHVLTYIVLGAILGLLLQILVSQKWVKATTIGEITIPALVFGTATTLAVLAITSAQGHSMYVLPDNNCCNVPDGKGGYIWAAWQYTNDHFYSITPNDVTTPGSIIITKALFYADKEGDFNLESGIVNANKDGHPLDIVAPKQEPLISTNGCHPSDNWYASQTLHLTQGYHIISFQLQVPASAKGKYNVGFAWFQSCTGVNDNLLHYVEVIDALTVTTPTVGPTITTTTQTTQPVSPTVTIPPQPTYKDCQPGTRQGQIASCVNGEVQYKYRTCFGTGTWSQWAQNTVECGQMGYQSCRNTGDINPDKPTEACLTNIIPSTTTTSSTTTTIPQNCREGQVDVGGSCTDKAGLYIIGGFFLIIILMVVVVRLRGKGNGG